MIKPDFFKLILLVQLLNYSAYAKDQTGFIPTPAGKIYYEARGSGSTLILIGGGGFVDLRQWDEVFDIFSKSYHVIRYDPIGTGRSDSASAAYSNADHLLTLFDSLKIRRANLIGLSFGGEIALEFTIQYPEKVISLVTSAPVVSGFERSEELKARVTLFAAAIEKGANELVNVLYQDPYFIPSAKFEQSLANGFRKLVIENYRKAAFLPTAPPQPVAVSVHAIKQPTLVIVGEHDHPDIHRKMMFLKDQIKNSEYAVIPNAGHMVNLENPKEFCRSVSDFLTALPKKSSSGYIRAVSGNLYYEEKGTGHPVIFIGRGAFMDSRQWDFAFEAASQNYRAIRYDPAGFGRSDLPVNRYMNEADLNVLFDSLRISKAVIVGVSFGGGIAMEFALRYPEKVTGLVLSAPAVSGFTASAELQKQNEKFMTARSQGTETLLSTIIEDENFIPTARKNKILRERFLTIVRANQRKIDPALLIPNEKSLFDESKNIGLPVLLVIGELDNAGLHKLTMGLQSKMIKSSLKVIKNAGHVPHNEAPEEFNRSIKTFIDELVK